MQSSGISSASPIPGEPSPRRTFALTGRSRPIDPLRDAARPDLADIRLADRVFAPHYAKALTCHVQRPVPLNDVAGGQLAALVVGEAFETLELSGGKAWGIAVAHGLVGYVAADALGR